MHQLVNTCPACPSRVIEQLKSLIGEVHNVPAVQVEVVGRGREIISAMVPPVARGRRRAQATLSAFSVAHIDEVPKPLLEDLGTRLAARQRRDQEARRLTGAFAGDMQQAVI
jgi:hypothetical protein